MVVTRWPAVTGLARMAAENPGSRPGQSAWFSPITAIVGVPSMFVLILGVTAVQFAGQRRLVNYDV